jgi:hypothetical protein
MRRTVTTASFGVVTHQSRQERDRWPRASVFPPWERASLTRASSSLTSHESHSAGPIFIERPTNVH